LKREKKEVDQLLKAQIEALRSARYDYPSHVWVPFEGSEAMEKLRKIQVELESEGYNVASQFSGAPVTRSERKHWASDWKKHVLTILDETFEGEEEFSPAVLNDMYDRVTADWRAAATSASVNPNEGENYETKEKIGDSVLKTGLQTAMIAARPDISEHELTVAVNTILAKQEQARISIALDLPRFLLSIYPDANTSEAEDMLEAFGGALYDMGQTENIGQVMVNQFIWYLNKKGLIKITGEVYDTPPKTQISILFSTLGWGSPIEVTAREGDKWRTRILVDESVRKTAGRRQYYILDIYDAKERVDTGAPYRPIPEQHINTIMAGGEVGNSTGPNPDLSIYNAYKDAVRRMKERGIIRDYQLEEHYRANQDFDPVYEEQYTRAYKRAKSMGYENIFSTDSKIRYDKNNTTAYISLIGIRRLKDGSIRKEPIYLLAIPNTAKNAALLSEPNKEELKKMSREQKEYTRDLAKGKRKELRRILYDAFANDKHLVRQAQENQFAVDEDEAREEDEEEEERDDEEEEGEMDEE
jgi:hypothetical protein